MTDWPVELDLDLDLAGHMEPLTHGATVNTKIQFFLALAP